VNILRICADEFRADLQEVYGLCLDDMGAKYTVKHACVLAWALPASSRTVMKMSGNDGNIKWGVVETLLSSIEYYSRINYFAKLKHADNLIKKAKVLSFDDFVPKEEKRKVRRMLGVSYDEGVRMLEMRRGVNNE
jgi:hypothetical protein